jgi:hypothetical protein
MVEREPGGIDVVWRFHDERDEVGVFVCNHCGRIVEVRPRVQLPARRAFVGVMRLISEGVDVPSMPLEG